MLTKLTIRNFKRFTNAEIELGNPVVFIGPNNSGKTTALQALALWEAGLRRLNGSSAATLNRKDLVALPVPRADLLWGLLQPFSPIEITVDGVTNDHPWRFGLAFEFSNNESLACKPTSAAPPPEALATRIAFLPSMSGLSDREFVKQSGEIDLLIGQGRTADVLRNICLQAFRADPDKWHSVVIAWINCPAWTSVTRSWTTVAKSQSYITSLPILSWTYHPRGAAFTKRYCCSHICPPTQIRSCCWMSLMRIWRSYGSGRSTTC